MDCPFTLCHGPLPMRSRAFTASAPCVLRYARHVRPPAPTAVASAWQCASAPASPPRLPPLPSPTLVMKNVIGCGGWLPRPPPAGGWPAAAGCPCPAGAWACAGADCEAVEAEADDG